MEQKFKLTEEQRQKKEKALHEMAKELKIMDYNIKHYKQINLKINALRNLKITLKISKILTPYALTAGITFGLFAAGNITPFILDNQKKQLNIMKEIDGNGNIRCIKQYEEFPVNSYNIYHYGKWIKSQDNTYQRKIEIFELKELTEETIIKLINEKTVFLHEIFGNPILTRTESRNNLTIEEINADEYIQAIIYSKDENDYIIVKEPLTDNIISTVLCFIITIFSELLLFIIRELRNKNVNLDELKKYIEEIKLNNPTLDIESLTNLFKIKKDNYERLTK